MATISPLLLACEESNKALVVDLITQGTDVSCRDLNNWTACHHASYEGWLDVVELLEWKGADLDDRTEDGDTPLLLAAHMRHESIVLWLINAGADITCSNSSGNTVLWYSLTNGLVKVMQLLEKRGLDFNVTMFPLLIAAKFSQKQVVQYLIDKGANLNSKGRNGWTVLHYAISKWPDVARCILERGGDVNARTSCGRTPMHCAVHLFYSFYSDTESLNVFVAAVELLCNYGADPNARTYNGSTPSHETVHFLLRPETWLKLKVFNCLFKAGADCNIDDNENKSLFDLFIHNDDIDLVRLGIENSGYFKEGFSPDEHPKLKEVIMRDASLCTRALINKYNHKDLPTVYELCHLSENFPSIKNMRIINESGAKQVIEEAVRRYTKASGYCNVTQVNPITLSMLTVKSILGYFNRNFS